MKKWLCAGVLLFVSLAGLMAQGRLTLKVAGVDTGRKGYTNELITQALKLEGYTARFQFIGKMPNSRQEILLASGDISFMNFGVTADRDAKFIRIPVRTSDGLIGKRIFFIPKGTQKDYDGVRTLQDYRKLNKVSGLGKSWADVDIWEANHLKHMDVDGDWKVLFRMVEAKNRGVDNFPRGAAEFIAEVPHHPDLDIEKNLVLVYDMDNAVYVTPKDPRLAVILDKALKTAEKNGLIKKLVSQFYRQAFKAPINVDKRIQIYLDVPKTKN